MSFHDEGSNWETNIAIFVASSRLSSSRTRGGFSRAIRDRSVWSSSVKLPFGRDVFGTSVDGVMSSCLAASMASAAKSTGMSALSIWAFLGRERGGRCSPSLAIRARMSPWHGCGEQEHPRIFPRSSRRALSQMSGRDANQRSYLARLDARSHVAVIGNGFPHSPVAPSGACLCIRPI